MSKKKIRLWKVGCHTCDYSFKSNKCERRPTYLVRYDDGDVVPVCYHHRKGGEIVAKIEWTPAAKRMQISMEGPDIDR